MERRLVGGFFICFCVVSPLITSTVGVGSGHHNDGGDNHNEPNAAERAIGLATPTGHWIKIKSWLNMVLFNLRPPDSGYDNQKRFLTALDYTL